MMAHDIRAAQALPDGRWHFQHGPIDIVIGAEGEAEALVAGARGRVGAFRAAC
jgi:hypothetical protein